MSGEFPDNKSIVFMVDPEVSSQEYSSIVLSEGGGGVLSAGSMMAS